MVALSPPVQPAMTVAPMEIAAMGRVGEVLERHQVAYVVMGGAAVASHAGDGEQMPTADMDTLIANTRENLGRAAAALEELDAVLLHSDGSTSPFSRPITAAIFTSFIGGTLTTQTKHGQLDLSFAAHAFPRGYDDVFARSSRRDLGGSQVRVADIDAVIESKEAAGRDKDLKTVPRLRRRFGLGPQG